MLFSFVSFYLLYLSTLCNFRTRIKIVVHGQRTVEIKCPYKHKVRSPFEAAQIDSSFCLDQAGNLKTSHKYYSQMQLQMHVNRVLCGDFVIYTLQELKVNEMIPYDKHSLRLESSKVKISFCPMLSYLKFLQESWS